MIYLQSSARIAGCLNAATTRQIAVMGTLYTIADNCQCGVQSQLFWNTASRRNQASQVRGNRSMTVSHNGFNGAAAVIDDQ